MPTLDLATPSPQNLILSPLYKDIYPANIWRERDQPHTEAYEVQPDHDRTNCEGCKKVKQRADAVAIVITIAVIVVLFTVGFRNIFNDD